MFRNRRKIIISLFLPITIIFLIANIPVVNAGEILNEIFPNPDIGLINNGSRVTLTFNVTFSDSYQSLVILLLNFSDINFNYYGFTTEMNGIDVKDQIISDLISDELQLICNSIVPANGSLSINIIFDAISEGNTTFSWRCIYIAYQQPPYAPLTIDLTGLTNVQVRSFEIKDLDVTPSEVEPGEEISVSVTISNIGSQIGTYKLEVKMDGEIIESIFITLNGGSSSSYQFTTSSNEEGSHIIEVEDLIKNFTVIPGSQPPMPPFIPPPIENDEPQARAGTDQTTFEKHSLYFDGSKSFDPDGNISTYFWTFGDGSLAYGTLVTHTYTSVGSYTVTLIVIDDLGASSSDNLTVSVIELPMIPENSVDEYIEANQTSVIIDALDVANTTLTLNSTDQVTIFVLTYSENPHPDAPLPPNTLSTVVDIAVSNLDAIEWPIHIERHYSDEELVDINEVKLILYYYKEGAWHQCIDTGVIPDLNIVWANMYEYELTGSPTIIGQLPHPATFELGNLTVDPPIMEPGENVTISIEIQNVGDAPGNYTLSFQLNGALKEHKIIFLNEHAKTTVSFIVTTDIIGTHFIEIDNLKNNFTVTTAPTPAEFEISNISVSPTYVESGDTVIFSVLVSNVGEEPGNYTVNLKVSGTSEEMRTITLPGDASVPVIFEVMRNVSKTYPVEINGLHGSFTVVSTPTPAKFIVTDLEIFPEEVSPGEMIRISVSILNSGEETGNYTIGLMIDGSIKDSSSVTLNGGATTSVNFFVSSTEEGTHTVEVEHLTSGFMISTLPDDEDKPLINFQTLVISVILLIILLTVLYYVKLKRNV